MSTSDHLFQDGQTDRANRFPLYNTLRSRPLFYQLKRVLANGSICHEQFSACFFNAYTVFLNGLRHSRVPTCLKVIPIQGRRDLLEQRTIKLLLIMIDPTVMAKDIHVDSIDIEMEKFSNSDYATTSFDNDAERHNI